MISSDIFRTAEKLSIKLPALKEAAARSEEIIDNFKELLDEILQTTIGKDYKNDLSDADVILLGSIARRESTIASDCDYYILQNGASPEVTRKLIDATNTTYKELEIGEPGGQGVFGKVVVAPNLYESIGLDVDSNANMTRRILLLAESEAVTEGKAHKSTIDNILLRYCADYSSSSHKDNHPVKVPRYLLNDLVRFWRTMAVDFGTKRWHTSKDETNVRLAKLMITRKLLFAGPLATLFLIPKSIAHNNQLQKHLTNSFKKSPLAQMASIVDLLCDTSKNALKDLLINYDKFIKFLGSKEREELKSKGQESDAWNHCKDIGGEIQKNLEIIFCDDELFKDNYRKYGVF